MPVRDDNASRTPVWSWFLSRLLNEAYDVSGVNQIYIFRQLLNIDVLVLVPELQVALIIEDKTSSQEHGNQIIGINAAFKNIWIESIQWIGYISTSFRGEKGKTEKT